MPLQTADRLAQQHQRDLATIAGGTASAVFSLALGADPAAISTWYFSAVDGILARIQAGNAQARRSSTEFLRRHAGMNGVDLTPVPSSLDMTRARTSVRVTGPVAFKTAIGAGLDQDLAVRSMAVQMSGASQRLVMAGERDTFEATMTAGRGIVGYRRVLVGKSCGFCAMLASRGGVYVTAKSASVARDGLKFHDHCNCAIAPLYEHEDDPADFRELQRQWQRVTAGKSGNAARVAWREHWENRATPAAKRRMGLTDLTPARPVAEAADPALKMTVAQLKKIAADNGVPLFGATRKHDIILTIRHWESDKLKSGGRVLLPDGPIGKPIRFGTAAIDAPPLGIPPASPVLGGASLNDWPDYFKYDLQNGRHEFVDAAGNTVDAGVRVRDLRVQIGAMDGSYPEYVVANGTAWRLDGVSYLIEHGPNDFGAPWVSRALTELRAAHEAIPAARRANKSYTLLQGSNPADVYWQRVYNNPTHTSAMSAGGGSIRIYTFSPSSSRIEQKIDLLRHETGHNLDFEVGHTFAGSRSPEWARAADLDAVSAAKIQDLHPTHYQARDMAVVDPSRGYPKGVTDYGRSAAAEDYAESVMLYQLGPIAHGRLPGVTRAALPDVKLPPGATAVTDADVLYFRDIYPHRAAILDKEFPDIAKAQKAELEALRNPPVVPARTTADLSKLQVAPLRALAREQGITLPPRATKAQIIEALNAGKAETAARTRQAALDTGRTVAEALAEVEELLANQASARALANRATGIAARATGDASKTLAPLVKAMETGDVVKIRTALASVQRRAKFEAVSEAGTFVRFDRATMEGIGGVDIPDGAWVLVHRPGFTGQVAGEQVRMVRAAVQRMDPPADVLERMAAAERAAAAKVLGKRTVVELRAMAADQKLTLPPKATKAQIIEALQMTPAERQAAAQRAIREAARERNRLIEQATGTEKLLAHLDEILAKGADAKVVRQALDEKLITPEQLFGNADPAVLASLKTAFADGDVTRLRAAITRQSTARKLKVVGGKAGTKVTFDPDLMESVGGSEIRAGTRVQVVTRGASVTLPDGSTLVLSKAKVAPSPRPASAGGVPKFEAPKVPATDLARAKKLIADARAIYPWDLDNLRGAFLDDADRAWLERFAQRNPETFMRMVQNQRMREQYADWRAYFGVRGSAAEVRAKMVAEMREQLTDAPIMVRRQRESSLRDILESGRMKTQFETGSSSGSLNTALRANYERMVWGYPTNLDPRLRPVYGYLAVSDDLISDAVGQYGSIRIRLKDSVRLRTSFTVADSLGGWKQVLPTPLTEPGWESFNVTPGQGYRAPGPLGRDYGSRDFRSSNYVEAQIHGGVRAEDIAEVIFGGEPQAETIAALERAGIPWRVE